MDIAKAVAGLILSAIFLLLPVWLARRKKVSSFDYWMETEGAPILGRVLGWSIIIFLALELFHLAVLLLHRFHQVF
jgi:hypothetical protein